MTTSPATSTDADSNRMLDYLFSLFKRSDRAPLAHLRQSSYDPTNAQAFSVVGEHLPEGLSRRDTDMHLTTACLFAVYVQPFVASGQRPQGQLRPHWKSVGASARLLRDRLTVGAESLDQRVTALINSHQDDLSTRLRRLMNRMSRENVEVDFDQLLKDLRAWGHNPRYVRRQWAEDYWQPEQSDIADSDSGHPDS